MGECKQKYAYRPLTQSGGTCKQSLGTSGRTIKKGGGVKPTKPQKKMDGKNPEKFMNHNEPRSPSGKA